MPLPFTSSAETIRPLASGSVVLIELFPPPGCTSRVSRPMRLDRVTSWSSSSAMGVGLGEVMAEKIARDERQEAGGPAESGTLAGS